MLVTLDAALLQSEYLLTLNISKMQHHNYLLAFHPASHIATNCRECALLASFILLQIILQQFIV